MKKIIILLVVIALVLVLVFVPGKHQHEGVWTCSYYAMYNAQTDTWKEQNQEFRDLFVMKIYDEGKVVVSTSGNETEGTYTINKDTLNLNIMNIKSQYVLDGKTLTLVKHPRAKIEYSKIAEIEGE